MTKIAIMVGHTEVAPGAKAVEPIGEHEYFFNKKLAAEMLEIAKGKGIEAQVFYRNTGGVKGGYLDLNLWAPTCAIELHFNAANGKAKGTCTLYGASNKLSGALARSVQNAMLKVFNRVGPTDRGIILLNRNDRGYFNVNQAKCPSVLIEPFFGDEKSDCELGFEKKSILALTLIETLIEFSTKGVTKNERQGGLLGESV